MSDSPSGAGPDWTLALDTPFADELRETLLGLPLRALHRFPPPRNGGLPFGHEVRIARRFLTGRSSSLDESGLWSAYQALASARERLALAALVRCAALASSAWEDLLGRDAVSRWRERGLVAEAGAGLRARFRVISLESCLLVADPVGERFPGYVHVGQDSLGLVEHVAALRLAPARRFLDVGTGSGVVLLACRELGRHALGVDINPRAARSARFSSLLSGASCEVRESDLFAEDLGERFGLVTWNLPFRFIPEDEREANLDGYGGHLGIELTLRFAEVLPRLLDDGGVAVVLTSAPILDDGRDELLRELSERCPRLGLDARIHVLQAYWTPGLWRFHRQHGVRRFESVILHLRHGAGRVERVPPSLARRGVDALRERVFYARYER
jgi:SAM-dependent methyltransferase